MTTTLAAMLIKFSICISTSLFKFLKMPEAGIEPARPKRARDFKSRASANSATPAENWRHGPESNRCIRVLQTPALPLGYRAGFINNFQKKPCHL